MPSSSGSEVVELSAEASGSGKSSAERLKVMRVTRRVWRLSPEKLAFCRGYQRCMRVARAGGCSTSVSLSSMLILVHPTVMLADGTRDKPGARPTSVWLCPGTVIRCRDCKHCCNMTAPPTVAGRPWTAGPAHWRPPGRGAARTVRRGSRAGSCGSRAMAGRRAR